jgi:L-ribulose-5-phosphate 3-epimerase
MGTTRRNFLAGIGATAVATAAGSFSRHALASESDATTRLGSSPFRISIISDEISQDFGHACEIASREFGMGWIELRTMWNKNIVNLDSKEIAEARRILAKYELRVTDIASPLFKIDWKGVSSQNPGQRGDYHADFSFEQQGEVLERGIELAKAFQTDRVRCFDFYRLEDQASHRAAINEKLLQAATTAGKKGITLLLENDSGLNTATGADAAKVLNAVKSPYLMLNWDPGNAAASGEIPFPDGYNLLPKERIGHCHCKDAAKQGADYNWTPMGAGMVDWASQFKALKRDGYRFAVSLETHWSGGGSQEQSSRQSWAGMKGLLQKAGAL